MTVAIPTLLLDDGSGTYPTDITSRLKLDGISFSGYGRSDEGPSADASTVTVTLDNFDSRFTNGTVSIVPGTLIRYVETVGATVKNRFTGAVESLDLGWPDGGQEFATVTVTAVDKLADLSRYTLRSMLEQEILLDSPAAYYTLGEDEGSTSAGDTSGNARTPLSIQGSGAALTFGSGTGPADGMSAATFAAGQYLTARDSPILSSTWSMVAFFSTTTAPVSSENTVVAVVFGPDPIIGLATQSFGVTSDGKVDGNGPVVTDGSVHCAVRTWDGTNARVYVDGVLASTLALGPPAVASTAVYVGKGPNATNGFPGVISHVALLDGVVLSSTRIASYAAALTGFTETTAQRFTRLASYAGVTSVSTPVNSGILVGAQATSGQSALDALQQTATDEQGVMFANGTGTLVLQGAGYRAAKITATLSLGDQEIATDTDVTWDTQQQVNQVTVSRAGGATQVIPTNPGPRVFPQSLDLTVTTDATALASAQWVLNKHQTTSPRLASATFDLLTSTSGASMLALEIGDRLNLSAMPSQLWPSGGDYVIEGWSESRASNAWTITYNLLPWSLFQAGIWDDTGSKWDTAVWAY